MPPHQEWDLNPVYQRSFTETYAEFFVSHPELGFMPSSMIEYSELTEEEWENLYREEDGVSDDSDSVVDMTEQQEEIILLNDNASEQLLQGYFTEEQIRDIFNSTVRVLYNGTGTVDDPIDLTNE